MNDASWASRVNIDYFRIVVDLEPTATCASDHAVSAYIWEVEQRYSGR
jgi:hypothetical protein